MDILTQAIKNNAIKAIKTIGHPFLTNKNRKHLTWYIAPTRGAGGIAEAINYSFEQKQWVSVKYKQWEGRRFITKTISL